MAKATVVRADAPIEKVVVEMTEGEARDLLDWIERRSYSGGGPVTNALRAVLR